MSDRHIILALQAGSIDNDNTCFLITEQVILWHSGFFDFHAVCLQFEPEPLHPDSSQYSRNPQVKEMI